MSATLRRGFFLLWIAGCTSAQSSVCQDIANCAAESSDQESTCEANAEQLWDEAADGGCASQYDAYFGCASNAYDCSGDTPDFAGCDSQRAGLDACLQAERASNACGRLDTALGACAAADAGAVPIPCGATEVCEADCYLENVADPCAPQPAELSAVQTCGAACS